jgi:hypothetical protein
VNVFILLTHIAHDSHPVRCLNASAAAGGQPSEASRRICGLKDLRAGNPQAVQSSTGFADPQGMKLGVPSIA